MVDENLLHRNRSQRMSSSDSSMVDENTPKFEGSKRPLSVQIPLWSMKTGKRLQTRGEISTGSDSSMVDENWNDIQGKPDLARSDSSMVDENGLGLSSAASMREFRFLYGR